MTVIPKEAVVCKCGARDSFIHFAGPGGSWRVYLVCSNEQTCIDVIVDLHQSDNPPADDNCSRCGCLPTWKYNPDGVKLCGDCNRRDEEYRDDMLRDAIGADAFDDSILEQQELEDFEGIEYEYFDLSDDLIPF